MILLPLIAGVQIAQMKAVSSLMDTRGSEAAGQIAAEAVGGIRTVAALGLQPGMMVRFTAALAKELSFARRRAIAAGLGTGAGSGVIFASYAAVFYAGGQLISRDVIAFQDMLQTFFAVTMAAQGVGMASSFAIDSGKANRATRAIFSLLDAQPAADPCPHWAAPGAEGRLLPPLLAAELDAKVSGGSAGVTTVNPEVAAAAAYEAKLVEDDAAASAAAVGTLELRNVVFAYPTRPHLPVLRGVSLKIQAGTTVALVGPSGSGKSSLVALLERWYDPQQGSVLLDGVDVRSLRPHALRACMALVSQEPSLFGDSVAYNIAFGRVGSKPEPGLGAPLEAGASWAGADDAADDDNAPEAVKAKSNSHGIAQPQGHHHGHAAPVDPEVLTAAAAANAADFISTFKHGYDTHVGDRGSQLSGGQKQRVAIARAVIRRSRILLCVRVCCVLIVSHRNERVAIAAHVSTHNVALPRPRPPTPRCRRLDEATSALDSGAYCPLTRRHACRPCAFAWTH